MKHNQNAENYPAMVLVEGAWHTVRAVEAAYAALYLPRTPTQKYQPGDVLETSTGRRYLVLDQPASKPAFRKIASCKTGIVYEQTNTYPAVVYRKGVRQ